MERPQQRSGSKRPGPAARQRKTSSHATPPPKTLKGKCWVIDGDTIVIDKMHIRLFGIDAPEMEHPYGQKAKWAMVNLCKGQIITAEFHPERSHDRHVATCTLPDGRDLSAELTKLGLAIDWPKYSGGAYRQYEVEGVRKKLWRCVARQQGRMPPPEKKDQSS